MPIWSYIRQSYALLPVANTIPLQNEMHAGPAPRRPERISKVHSRKLGDDLIAEYVLLHLISSVFKRVGEVALGRLAIAVTHVTPSENEVLSAMQMLLETLVPHGPCCR